MIVWLIVQILRSTVVPLRIPDFIFTVSKILLNYISRKGYPSYNTIVFIVGGGGGTVVVIWLKSNLEYYTLHLTSNTIHNFILLNENTTAKCMPEDKGKTREIQTDVQMFILCRVLSERSKLDVEFSSDWQYLLPYSFF